MLRNKCIMLISGISRWLKLFLEAFLQLIKGRLLAINFHCFLILELGRLYDGINYFSWSYKMLEWFLNIYRPDPERIDDIKYSEGYKHLNLSGSFLLLLLETYIRAIKSLWSIETFESCRERLTRRVSIGRAIIIIMTSQLGWADSRLLISLITGDSSQKSVLSFTPMFSTIRGWGVLGEEITQPCAGSSSGKLVLASGFSVL